VRTLIVGDVHLSDRPPASCGPNYNDQILQSLIDIGDACNRYEVDHCIFAGDIFHSKIPSRTSHRTMVRLMEALDYIIDHQDVSVFIVPGNHDMQNDRIESIPNQPLGAIFASGLAWPLDDSNRAGKYIGVPWQQDWSKYDWHFPNRGLMVAHAPIMPVSEDVPFECVPHTAIFKAMADADIMDCAVYYGHIHDDHGTVEDPDGRGNTISNFGAISRGSLHELNLNRELAVALWDAQEPQKIERIPLPTRPIDQVIRPEAIEKHKTQTDARAFLESLHSAQLVRMTPQAVQRAAEKMGCSDAVIKLVRELMETQ
jgi:hypothetical protein